MDNNQYQDQANINLNLFNGNAEQWTIALDKTREANEKGIPVSVHDVLESDNNEIIGLSANGLHPRLQKTLAENPLRVTTYRDQLPQLDAFARAADWAEKSREERAAAIREQYRTGGVPAAKQREMGVSGVRKVSGGKFEDGAGNSTDPVSYWDTCGPEERQMLEKALQSAKKASGDVREVRYFPLLSKEGQGMVLNILIAKQKKANLLLGLLHTEVGPEWRDMSDADKKRYIEAIGSSRGMDFSDVDLKMLEKGGFGDVDYLEMTNILGIRDLYKLATAKTPEELAAVGDTSPLSDKFALLTHLRDQALEMRGLGAAAGTAQMIASSIPFMVELGLTGGMATVGKLPLRVAVKQALKAGGVEGLKGTATALFRKEGRHALGEAARAIAVGEAKRTPAFIPKMVAQTANEFNEGPVVVPGEDGMQLAVPERKADELVTILLRNVIANYTERTTEWGGEFLPDVNILSRMIPRGVKNRIAQAVLNTTWDAADSTKRGLLRTSFLDDIPFSGTVAEFLEEKINTLAYYVMTRVSEATGAEALNMGQETPLGTWQENLQTLVSVMVQSNVFRIARLSSQVQNVRDLTRLVDNHRVMRSAAANVPLEQRSTTQSREFYDLVREGDRDYYISTEDALTYFQSDPEMAKACGITEETIREAEEKGLYVAVSENRMLAEEAKSPAAKEAGERLLAMVRQSGITIGEALKNDVGEEVVKGYQEQQERVQRYRKRFAEIFSAAEAAGVSQRAIKGNAELIGRILNHIAAGMKNSESVEKALDGLITVMEQDPENFARNVQMGLRPEYLTEATEEVLTTLEAVADAPIEAEEEAEVETPAAEPIVETPVETPAAEPVVETPELTAEETAILEEIQEPVSANRTLELVASLTEEQAEKYLDTVTSQVKMYRKQFENAGADEGEMTIRAWAAVARVLPRAKGDPKNLIFTAIKNAIYSYLGEVQRKETGKVSINKEIGDDGATLEDFVSDTGMDAPYAELEAMEASEEAKLAVRAILKAINKPPANTSGEAAEVAVKTRKMILRGLLSGQKQTEIAKSYGTSKQNVSQMTKRLSAIVARTSEKYDANREEVRRALIEAFKNEPDAFYQAELADRAAREVSRQIEFVKNKYADEIGIAPNGKKSNLTDYQWVLTRTLFFKRWFGNWNYDPEQKIEVTVLEKDALENAGVDVKDTYGSLLAAINHYYNRQTPVTIKDDGSLAFFSNQNNRASLKDQRSPRDIFSALDKVIENAVFYDFRGGDGLKKHESISGQYLYKSAFRVGNSTFAATIILDEKKTTFSKVFKGYTISKIEVEGVDAASGSETTLREPVNRSTPSYITIAQAAKNVKPESSKIVDENGEPRVVYHGSTKHQRHTVLDPRRGYNVEALWHATNPHVAMHWGDWRITRYDESLPEKIEGASDMKSLIRMAKEELGITVSVERNEVTAEDAKRFGVEPGVRYRVNYMYDPAGGDISSPVPGAKNEGDVFAYLKKELVKDAEGLIQQEHDRNGFTYANFASVKNPLVVDAKGAPYHKVAFEGRKVATETLAEIARERGHDGVLVTNVKETDFEDQVTDDIITFNAPQIKSATDNAGTFDPSNPDIRYQQGGVIYRGAAQFGTYFDQNYRAIITLFQGTADASTLVHESAHWLKRLMQSLCEMRDAEGNYIAEDSLREEFASIEKWLDGQKYTAEKGSPEYIIERDEKFARAFEYYVMKGGTPPAQVTSAFATLRNMLLAIYREIASFPEKFGFVFSDDIKSVFDRMMATDTVLERESQLREAAAVLRETFAGLLGLSGEEMDNMQRIIKLADSQMVAELDRHQNKLLPAFRREWRREAQEQMAEMREYQAWNACRKTDKADGRLDTDLLKSEPGISEDMVKLLHSRGLTVRNGANPADLMKKLDYASVQEMVQDLAKMQTPKEFTDNYLKEQEEAFRQNLTLDEKTMSVSGIRDLLDELHRVLSIRGGREGNAIRKGEAENAALKELGEKSVNWVESDKKFLNSLKEHSRDLSKAVAKKDYLLALEHLNAIRKLYAVLREKADAKKRIEKTRNKLRTVMRSKPKSGEKAKFYGDYYDALTELAYYFGFTKKRPKEVGQMEPNFRQQVVAEEAKDDMQDASPWEEYLFSNNEVSYGDMTWEQFSRFADFVDYLYGRGRELVADDRESFGAKVKAGKEAIAASLADQPAKYHRRKETAKDKITSAGRSLLHIGNNLRYLLGKADRFRHMAKDGKIGPCLHIRELLVPGASEAVRLEVETMAKIRESMNALWDARERILMPENFRFTGEGLVYGYSRWTPEMVIKACLNLGNPVNRDRLVRGFGWEDKDLNELATCIPADLWPHIQKIWDALGGDLQKAAARTFLAENFYKMPLVKAEGMTVRYPDGQMVAVEGGYFPIQYAHHEKSKSKPIPQSHSRGLYAEVSSTMLRKDDLQKVNPLNLSMNGVVKHIHETAWYAATRMACREAISIFRSSEVEMAFGSTQGFEAYDQALNLLRNFANPDAMTEGMGGDGGFMDMFERWGKTVMTSGALMANLSSIMKQPASLTVGANETGQYMLDALAAYSKNPVTMTAKVKALSAMMRERVNYMDPDLREDIGKFGVSKAERGRRTMMRVGYAAMRCMDGMVAVPVWYSKYQQVMDRLMKKEDAVLEEASKQAVAEADDFVARTQGAGRLLDLTSVQLDRVGRLLSPFMTAANAQFNTSLETIGAVRHGVLSPGQALMALTMNLFAPAVYSAAVVAVLNGALSDDDDDIDRALKAALVEMLTSPFSGFPLVRDVGQRVAGTAVDIAVGGKKSYRPLMFSAAPFEAASRIFESVTSSGEALTEGEFSRAAWKAADAVGDIYGVPVIRIYERAVRQYKRSGGELPELLETLEKSTKKGGK